MKNFLLSLNRKFQWLLPLHVFASFAMTGIMLFTQFVHYPMFRYIDPNKFFVFYSESVVRFTPFIGFLMTLELVTALGLFVARLKTIWTLNFLLVLATWVLTGFWQGPIQMKLTHGYDLQVVEMLIRTNIWRTLLWLPHSLLVLWSLTTAVKYFFKMGER